MIQLVRLIEVLNDLIRINNDRITVYEKAAMASRTISTDLKNVFHHLASESRKHVRALSTEVINLRGKPATGSTTMGKLYQVWSDLKAGITGVDSRSLLAYCLGTEDSIQKIYGKILAADIQFPPAIHEKILLQQQSLKNSHDLIIRYQHELIH
ncbi:MAG TPA: PA2169 family four-helix-bundle protein [Puia sp.]|nr:PA2169 family four-helix-bundle protein [Puia sp.]